jgi:EAL domain-containing protein (putative c-di-GMP-specific phosphodiesterase class I)
LVSEIARAIQAEKLVLYFQDIVPVGSSREYTPHGEVLVRMLGEQGELVSPGLFLPAAERYDLMPSVDLWVVRNTFAWWAARCADSGARSTGLVSINLSGKSLGNEPFQDKVLSLISEYQILPGTVCFEITETAAISNFELATRFIDRLRSRRMRITLDDFGSGLSSFAYLKNLSVDYLKIDGGFVRDTVDDPINREMVKSIHQLARVMGIQTIAECVENDAIFAHLKEIGIDYAQGYGVAEPRPLTEIAGQLSGAAATSKEV